ncbi:hypothetical protein M419DRAFT_122862 [Trichoderma reesei RUT C-30]|uniref:Uncharacterized protein n=1 Tax=Hypocrea jecorina (strain ATCC 56765 / BCRC 32924 / NRRL 11460 / Rut C-30) TaxID=1344414 RepID=A0A024SC68_HYPJR|nr:hypothetical protein M419DRAFT_122862 [Trichoderma reesei RUT C-30]
MLFIGEKGFEPVGLGHAAHSPLDRRLRHAYASPLYVKSHDESLWLVVLHGTTHDKRRYSHRCRDGMGYEVHPISQSVAGRGAFCHRVLASRLLQTHRCLEAPPAHLNR